MSKKMVALTSVLVFLLGGFAVFGFLTWKHTSEMKPASVSFTVNAKGWSEETSSPIPLHVKGETADKEKVDERYFIGQSENDLTLQPGTYTVEVYASPINADGGMYKTPEPVKLVIPKNTDKPKTQPSAEINLSSVPVNKITDDDIEKAQAAMKEAGLSEKEINTFVEAARQARQAELDRLKKERKAKEEAELVQKTFGSFAGQYWFEPSYTACGMPARLTLDGNTAKGSFEFGHMGAAVRNEFSITFSDPVLRNGGFEASYQITYVHTPGTPDPDNDYCKKYDGSCTFDTLAIPDSGKAIFYNPGVFQSDSKASDTWKDCVSSDFMSSSTRTIKLSDGADSNIKVFFAK